MSNAEHLKRIEQAKQNLKEYYYRKRITNYPEWEEELEQFGQQHRDDMNIDGRKHSHEKGRKFYGR